MSNIKVRARSKETGEVLEQLYNGRCFQWVHEGQDIIIEPSTGLTDANGVEVYVGDRISGKSVSFCGIDGIVVLGTYDDCEGYQCSDHTGYHVGGVTLKDLIGDGCIVTDKQ